MHADCCLLSQSCGVQAGVRKLVEVFRPGSLNVVNMETGEVSPAGTMACFLAGAHAFGRHFWLGREGGEPGTVEAMIPIGEEVQPCFRG